MGREGVSCPRGCARGLAASRSSSPARLPRAFRPSPESYAETEQRPRAVTAIAVAAAASRCPPQVSRGCRARRGRGDGLPVGRRTDSFSSPVRPHSLLSRFLFPGEVSPRGAVCRPGAEPEGAGSLLGRPGRLPRDPARPSCPRPERRVGVSAPAGRPCGAGRSSVGRACFPVPFHPEKVLLPVMA